MDMGSAVLGVVMRGRGQRVDSQPEQLPRGWKDYSHRPPSGATQSHLAGQSARPGGHSAKHPKQSAEREAVSAKAARSRVSSPP